MWFGFTGIYRFIKKQYLIGIIYLLTFGLFGIGWLYDTIIVIKWSLKVWPKYEKINKTKKFNTEDVINTKKAISYPTSRINIKYDKCYELPKNFVVLDFETSGLSHENDEIIEIGVLKYIDFEIIDKFETLVNPKKKISERITSLTHITNEMLAKAPTIDFTLPKLLDFIGNEIIIAHNASFDMKFLLQNIGKLNIQYKNYKVIDTLQMSRKLIDIDNHKLETLKNYLNLSECQSHRAIGDCFITASVYKHLYQVVNNSYDIIKLEYFNTVKEVLMQNNLDTSLIKFDELKSGYNYVKYYFIIFEFKIGKKNYALTKKSKEDVLAIWNEAVLEEATKSEYGNTRILLNSPNDIFNISDIIVEKYHQVIEKFEKQKLLIGNEDFLKGYYY